MYLSVKHDGASTEKYGISFSTVIYLLVFGDSNTGVTYWMRESQNIS